MLPERFRPSLPPWLAAALAAAVVTLALMLVTRGGFLEGPELAAYDLAIRERAEPEARDSRVAMLSVTEADIRRLGSWPLTDNQMADLLGRLLESGPRAIGIDIYRDIPVGEGRERLNAVLAANPMIVPVFRLRDALGDGISPPPAFADSEQIGFNNYPLDPDGVLRRALLFADEGEVTRTSMPLRLALAYLEKEGVVPEGGDEDPTWMKLGRTTFRPLESSDGAYVGVDTAGYQFLLDWKPGGQPFAVWSLGELLDGKVPRDAIAGRVIVIGVNASSVKDTFQTPYTRSLRVDEQIFGSAVHGFAVAQILRAALDGAVPTSTWSDGAELLWLGAWIALGSLLGLWASSALRLLAVLAGGVFAVVAIAQHLFSGGIWIPVAGPGIGFASACTLVVAYSSARERRERAELMRIFHRSVSPQVAESMWERRGEFMSGGRPRPQELVATVLFSDIRGFTTVSEGLSAPDLLDWLNEYMDAMAAEVMRHGGVVDKYIGDAVMAVFGVPLARATEEERNADAENAVRAALAMGKRLEALNLDWHRRGIPEVGMRIGIFTGDVVAGVLGSADRLEYTVLGDTVNTASRLESVRGDSIDAATGEVTCRILIGDSTLERVAGRFVTRKVGDVNLKGKTKPVGIHSVTAVALQVAVALMLATPRPGAAEPAASAAPPNVAAAAVEGAKKPLYQPPRRGAPLRTEGGGTRGSGPSVFLATIAPQDTGLTASDQPSLYWYLGAVPASGLVFTLTDENNAVPLVEKSLPSPAAAGLQRVALTDLGMRLVPGVEYRWSVAVVVDAAQRSKDIVATAGIKRVAAPPTLAAELTAAKKPNDTAAVYGEAGLWYEMVAAIAAAKTEYPQLWTGLLEQVELTEVTSREKVTSVPQ